MTKPIKWKSIGGVLNDQDPKAEEMRELAQMISDVTQEGHCCLDVGFNYGWATYHFLKATGRQGKVFAWEPNEYLFDNHCTPLPFHNFKGYRHAVCDLTGKEKFHVYGDQGHRSGWSSLTPIDNAKPLRVVDVDTIRLDDWWRSQNFIRVDIIKIDVEGHDRRVILGAQELIKHNHPAIIIEMDDPETKELLSSMDYSKNDASRPNINLWT
jgi:FkbM family methyltransferase